MKFSKCITVLTILLFLTITIQSTTAKAKPWEDVWFSDELNIIEKLMLQRWLFGKEIFGTPFNVLRFTEPEPFTAEPNVLSIEYLEQTDIIIGVKDENGYYKSLLDYDYNTSTLFLGYDYECHLEIPDYIPENAFIAHFDPQLIVTGQEGELKTKLRIASNIPKDATLPKNIQLRVNISKYTTFGNLNWPALGNFRRVPILGFILAGTTPIMWHLAARGWTNPGNPFGKLFTGKRLLEYSAYVDIVVRLDRFHLVDMIPQEGLQIGPDQLITIPLQVQNLGSHVDCFNFRVGQGSDSQLVVSPPPALTLGPNEIGYTSIGIAFPRIFNDPGTARTINIEAYSIYEPTTVFNNTATLITRGIYIHEVTAMYSATLLVIILLILAFFYSRKRKTYEKMLKKPNKPWTLPEERAYLEELKKKDKKEYEEVRLLMEDEYKSSLLWYKDEISHLKKQQKQKPKKQKIKPVKKQKEKSENTIKAFINNSKNKKSKQEQSEEIPKQTIEEPIIKEKPPQESKKKQALLAKIQRQQEKQKRKLRK